MKTRLYLLISATMFTIVALAHAARVILSLPITIGTYSVPMALSWGGIIWPGFLAFWGFMAAKGNKPGE